MLHNILLIILGCNISHLLNDRITTAVQFAGNFNETSVNWFLSGGIKHLTEDVLTESEKMAAQIMEFEKTYIHNTKWNYIYDKVATNTAENFIMVKKHLDEIPVEYSKIFVVTSNFHYNRAKKIAEQIIDGNKIDWVLSNAELQDSRYWENIHIKNVDTDVEKAITKFK